MRERDSKTKHRKYGVLFILVACEFGNIAMLVCLKELLVSKWFYKL